MYVTECVSNTVIVIVDNFVYYTKIWCFILQKFFLSVLVAIIIYNVVRL